jgi:AcrR family transcriptional regulator
MAKPDKVATDSSTEEKIRQAARKVFTRKGFAATRTRDIAEEAGINLALLSYYFRSKQKLFDIIMMENMQQFLQAMHGELSNEHNTLIEKVAAIADNYIDLLKTQPDLPIFIMTELKTNPGKLAADLNIKQVVMKSRFAVQLKEANPTINPLHFLMNIVGLTVFPFIASPLLMVIGDLKQPGFNKLMEERKKLIPVWIKAMLKAK